MTTYAPFDCDQPFLLPPDLKDWLLEDDLVHYCSGRGGGSDENGPPTKRPYICNSRHYSREDRSKKFPHL